MFRSVILVALLVIAAPIAAKDRGPSGQTRPTDLVAADLGIAESDFVSCFAHVSPDPNHAPDGATQRANKSVLLPCLQQANGEITNDLLDSVMDRYRPEGPMH